ncbi:hypothetical protein BpHYR1_001270 [Brachionus plicatilis]|uniref:Uncharacterized protein n=1 Tax=Brachionus plicatilis TaxID=10195 RepID=A0A3M7RAQ5_BRAPC|nr:hypothetical protein BpHYR1_001270 [Brachionus plicatilis]
MDLPIQPNRKRGAPEKNKPALIIQPSDTVGGEVSINFLRFYNEIAFFFYKLVDDTKMRSHFFSFLPHFTTLENYDIFLVCYLSLITAFTFLQSKDKLISLYGLVATDSTYRVNISYFEICKTDEIFYNRTLYSNFYNPANDDDPQLGACNCGVGNDNGAENSHPVVNGAAGN